jgi:hypothetical protein
MQAPLPPDPAAYVTPAETFANLDVQPQRPRAPRRRQRRTRGPVAQKYYTRIPLTAANLTGEARLRVTAKIDRMRKLLPKPALLVYWKACDLQDLDRMFDMSAAVARAAYSDEPLANRRRPDKYLALLVKAGLIARVASGYTGVASEYRVVEYNPMDMDDMVDYAIAVLLEHRDERREQTAPARVREGRPA